MTTASAMNHITAQDVDVLLEAELASHDPAAPARLFTVLQGPARSSPPALHVGCGKMTIGCDALCDEAHGEPSVSSSAVTAPVAPPSLVSPSAATWPQESAATATQPDSTQSSAETVQPSGDTASGAPSDFIVIHGVKLPLKTLSTEWRSVAVDQANMVKITLHIFRDEHTDWLDRYCSIKDRLIAHGPREWTPVPVQHPHLADLGVKALLFTRVSLPRRGRDVEDYEVDLEGVPPRHRPAAHLPGPLGLMQARAAQTAIYPGTGTGDRDARLYTALSLAGEAGEVAGKASKVMRDGESSALMAALYTELGDVFWHWLQCCQEWGAQPDQVAEAMFQRLQDRRRRGTLQGSGDER